MVERVEVGNPGDFNGLTSTAAIVDRELELLIEKFIPIDEKDRQGLIELHERHLKEAAEYIAAIQARPIIAERVDARNLKTPWQEHDALKPLCVGIGGFAFGNIQVSKQLIGCNALLVVGLKAAGNTGQGILPGVVLPSLVLCVGGVCPKVFG